MSDEEPKTRSAAERVRLQGSIQHLRGLIGGIETALSLGGPVGTDVAQALLLGASSLALQLARHDAYDMYEQDAKNRAGARPEPCGRVFTDYAPGLRVPKKNLVCNEEHRCATCSGQLSQWNGSQKQKPF